MPSSKTDQLRKRAEELYKKRKESVDIQKYADDLEHLIEELNVYQIELDLQNEELVKAEEKQRIERKKFNDLFEFSTHGIFTLDRSLRISNVNLTALHILKRDRSSFISQKFDALFCEDDHQMGYLQLQKVLKEKEIREFDAQLKLPDGGLIIARINAKYHQFEEYDDILLTLKDVTEERAKNEQVIFQAKMLESIEEAVIVTDADGKVIYWSKSAEKLYGWSENEALGKDIVKLTPSTTSRKQANEIMSQLLKGKSWSGEFPVRDKNKREFVAHVSDNPVMDDKGNLKAVIGVSRDVSERVAREQEIKRLSEQRKEILSSISDGFFALDKNLKILYFNKAAETMLGRNWKDIEGQRIFEAFPEAKDSIFEKEYRLALKEQKFRSFETYFGKEPYANWYEVRVFPGNGGIVVYFQVITERKIAEQSIRDKNRKIREQNLRLDNQNQEFQAVNEELQQTNEELEDLNEKLLKSEEKYRLLFEESTDPCLIIQGDSFAQANKAALDFLGMKNESEIKGKRPWEISPDSQQDGMSSEKKAKSMIRQAIRKGYHRFEWIHVNKDNEERWIDVALTYLPGSKPKSVYTVWRDITELKEASQIIQRKNEEIAAQNEELRVQYEELAEQTDRIKKNNKELQVLNEVVDSERKTAQNYLDVAEVMMIAIDASGVVTLANKKAANVLGLEEGEIIGKNWFEHFLPQENVQEIKNIFNKIIQGEIEQLEYVENYVVSKSGEKRMIAWHNTLLKDENGTLTGTLSSGSDITEKWLAEKALGKSREELKAIFDMSLHMICIADINTMSFTRINPAFSQILGYNDEELLGKSFLEFLHPDDVEFTKQVVDRQLKKGKKVLHFENRYICKDGSYRWLDWVSHPVPDLGITYAIAIDISEQKEAELALQQSENKYRSLFDNMQEGVALHEMIFDENDEPIDFVFLDVNPTYEKLTRLKKKDILGKKGTEVIPKLEQKWLDLYGKLTKTGHSQRITDHSEYLDKYWDVKAFRPAEGKFAVAMTDVTENIKSQMLLEESEKRFRSIIESTPMGTLTYLLENDGNLKLTGYNESANKMLNFDCSTLLGKTIEEAFPGLVETEVPEVYRNVARTGKSWFTEQINYNEQGISGAFAVYAFQTSPMNIAIMFHEISDRLKAEQRLKESEERFNLAMKAANDGLFDWDLKNNTIYYSPRWKSMLGYREDELPNDFSVWENLTHPEDVKESWKRLEEHIAGKRERFEMEFKMKHKKGHWVDILSRAEAVLDSEGKAVRLVGTHVDISDRKKAELALKLSEEKLKLAMESAGEGIWEWDLIADKVKMDAVALKKLGYSAGMKEYPGQWWIDRIHPQDRPNVEKLVQAYLQGKSDAYKDTFRMKHKKGHYVWISSVGTIINLDEDGNPMLFLGIYRDITEQIEADNKIKQNLNEREWILKSMLNAFVIFDSVFDEKGSFVSYRFVYINDAYEKITGVKNEDVKGKTVHEVWPETEPEWISRYGHTAVTGETQIFDLFHAPTDKLYHCNVYRPWESQERFCVIFEDITEKQMALKKLSESEERLRNIVEHSTNMFYSHTTDHLLTYVSPQSKKILGYSPEELKIKWTEAASDHPVNKLGFEITMKAIETGVAQDPYEMELVQKSGEKVWVEVREAPLVEDGRTIAMVGALVDITKRKEAEKALRESQEMYKSLVNTNPDAITLTDREGVISFVSPNMEKLFKTGVNHIVGTHVLDWIDPLDHTRAKANVQKIINGEHLGKNDYNMIDSKGESFIGESVSSAVRDSDGKVVGMISILRDVTQDVEMQEELNKHRMHLEELVKERTSEIEQKNKQLERMNKLFVGREFRIKELRETVKELKNKIENPKT